MLVSVLGKVKGKVQGSLSLVHVLELLEQVQVYSLLGQGPGAVLGEHSSALVSLPASVLVAADSVLEMVTVTVDSVLEMMTAGSVLGLYSSLGHTLGISPEKVLLGSALWFSSQAQEALQGTFFVVDQGALVA